MSKMTTEERAECQRNLATCQSAVATFQKMLKDDDEAADKAVRASDSAMVAAAGKRSIREGILLARELPRRGGPAE